MQANQYTKTTNDIGNYIGWTYKHGMDAKTDSEHINVWLPLIAHPADPPATATQAQVRIREKQIDSYAKQVDQRDTNSQPLYSLI
jgi:hypothetical protein